MKINTPEKRALIDAMVREHPHTPSRTLARLLFSQHPRLFPSLESARDAVRARRGAHGKKNANLKKVPWKKGRAGQVHLPPSKARPFEPERMTGRVLVLSDAHIPYHDDAALAAAIDAGAGAGCDAVLIAGDFGDFFSISRFLTNPAERDLVGELAAIDQALAHLRRRFPKARIVWKLGNHEERWEHYLWQKAPELLGLPTVTLQAVTNCEKHRVEIVGSRRPVRLGKLTFLHGHELEQGAASPVNPARGVFLRTLDSYCIGHRHRTSEHTEKTANGRFITCWSLGCLCDLTPQYSVVNKWNHGFAIIETGAGGTFRVENRRIHEGRVF